MYDDEQRTRSDVEGVLEELGKLGLEENARVSSDTRRKLRDLSAATVVSVNAEHSGSASAESTCKQVKAEPLRYPRFSGEIREYPVFRRNFCSMVMESDLAEAVQLQVLYSQCLTERLAS